MVPGTACLARNLHIHKSFCKDNTVKILKIIDYFYPAEEAGGPIPVAYNFATRFIRHGHEVTIWTSNLLTANTRMGNKTFTDQLDGINVVYLNSPLRYRWAAITPSLPQLCREQLGDFDIIHFYGYRGFMPLVASWYAKKYRVPYVLQALGTVPILARSRIKKYVYDQLLGYRILQGAEKMVAKTPLEKSHYLTVGISEDKIELVPNGIELSECPDDLTRGEFKKRFNINSDDKIILFLARIHKRKGIDLLVKAFSKVEVDNVKLVVVGPDDGFLKETIALVNDLQLNDKVIFTGPLYGRDKFQAYMDADVYVLPAIQENFPKSVLEAILCKVPIIITEDCGISYVVRDRVGLAVPYELEALSGAVTKLLSDRGLSDFFRENAPEVLQKYFSWETHVPKLENLYLDVINGRP